MAPAVPEERNTGRQLATCSPRHGRDGGVWHCVSLRRPQCRTKFKPLFITAWKRAGTRADDQTVTQIMDLTEGNMPMRLICWILSSK